MRRSYQTWNTTGKRRACTRTAHSGLQRSLWRFISWSNRADIHRARSKDQWRVLSWRPPRSTFSASNSRAIRRILHLSARQCISSPSLWYSRDVETWNACFHCTVLLAAKQPWSQSCRLQDLGSAARSSVPDEDTWCVTSEAAPDWGVAAVWSEHHRRCS